MLKQLYIAGIFMSIGLFILFRASNSVIAKSKSILEEEFNKSREAYNQHQIIYKKAVKRYEQQIELNKPFAESQKQQEEYNSLLVMYKQQQEEYYKLSELDRQLREEIANLQTPFQLVSLGIGLICLIPAAASFLTGIIFFYILKNPFGKKLIKFGVYLGIICGFSFLLARKDYIFAFAFTGSTVAILSFLRKTKFT